MPQRFTTNTPSLVFTTLEHGNSLKRLYDKLDELEYCIIAIKTSENEVFGAFCSGSWCERKNAKIRYFGKGETFLFTLLPKEKIYRWVGINEKTTANQEMFIRADNKQIIIGGGYVNVNVYCFQCINFFIFLAEIMDL